MASSLMVKEISHGSTGIRVSLHFIMLVSVLVLTFDSLDAMRSFAEAQSQWYPSWPQNLDDRAMVVDYVKMWRHCDGD